MGSRLEVNSSAVRKRIQNHRFDNEEGEEYGGSKFGGFPEYFRRKKIKLQNLDTEIRSTSENKPPIFRGIVAHVNGYTQPSLNDLHNLIVAYGGGFMQYLDGKTTVTHIVASHLTPKKKVEFNKYRIIKPAWVVDSIKAGRLLPWNAYRVVDEGIGQQILTPDSGNVISQVNRQQSSYRSQTNTSWYTEQVKDLAKRLNNEGLPTVRVSSAQASVEDDFDDEQELSTQNTTVEQAHSPNPSLAEQKKLAKSDQSPTASEQGWDNASNRQDASGDLDPSNTAMDIPSEQDVASDATSEAVGEENVYDLSAAASGSDDPTNKYSTLSGEQSAVSSFNRPVEESKEESTVSRVGSKILNDVSPEEHNAMLLADRRVWKSTVVNPGFLKQYYEESRLHHLSAWKAELKSQLQALAAEKSSSQKARQMRTPGSRRYILHVDFDSFFAAVSLKKCPQLIEKPVVVAHGGGSGSEIASCNYPARKFGIKNGMWMKHAQKMCPELKVLPYDFNAYEEASKQFYHAIMDTGGIVQSVSIDEALIDVSVACVEAGGHHGVGVHEGSIWREQAKADEIAQHVRDRVKLTTGCAVSVGVGGNILLAKVALRKAKPAGQFQIKPEQVLDFIGNLTVQELPGVAHSIGGKLEELGVKYVKDVRELTKERLMSTLGPKTGQKIWDYSRGIDRVEVGEQVIRKSVSAEVNWGTRFVTQGQADEFVESLCDELHKRLESEKVKGRQLTMKIMRRAADAPLDPPKHLGHGKCDVFNKSIVLGVATNDKDVLSREAISVMKGWGFSPGELRGIGVQMTRLEPLQGPVYSPRPSSQKRLTFPKQSSHEAPLHQDDPIDEIDSPKKSRLMPQHPAAAFASEISPSGKRRSPLNIFGTQFVLPTQADPEVLAEIPRDIKSKLKAKALDNAGGRAPPASPRPLSRPTSPARPPEGLPTHSQLDAEALEALPEDVRAEILAFYQSSPRKANAQSLLPQSPHKNRTTNVKKQTTPTKNKKRMGLLSRTKLNSAFSTLTQSNFVANRPSLPKTKSEEGKNTTPVEISDEFLSALPPDIRSEVLAQARRDRLQKRAGIDLSTSRRARRTLAPQSANAGQRKLQLQRRPPKPTFTARRLTSLPDLREAMTAWFNEFKDDGPFDEDVNALMDYLRKVVQDEEDMAKAIGVGKWLWWIIENAVVKVSDQEVARGLQEWRQAALKIREGIQNAVSERGLGVVEF